MVALFLFQNSKFQVEYSYFKSNLLYPKSQIVNPKFHQNACHAELVSASHIIFTQIEKIKRIF